MHTTGPWCRFSTPRMSPALARFRNSNLIQLSLLSVTPHLECIYLASVVGIKGRFLVNLFSPVVPHDRMNHTPLPSHVSGRPSLPFLCLPLPFLCPPLPS